MLFGKKNKNQNTYRLKTMAMARVFSEVAALSIFLCLPFILLFAGLMAELDLVVKAAVVLGAVFALLMLPAYGFITWQISITETGIIGWSLIKRREIAFDKLTRLTRKSNFNWQRYILTYDGGDITFPLWFERLDDLIKSIRERLPADLSPNELGPRLFRQDTISFLMQFSQVTFGLVLTGVATYFAAFYFSSNRVAELDALLIMVFVIVLGLSMFYRAIVVTLMPYRILVGETGIDMSTVFFKKHIDYKSLEMLTASSPFLPEGFMLQTTSGTYLIGSGFDSLDELVADLRSKKIEFQK